MLDYSVVPVLVCDVLAVLLTDRHHPVTQSYHIHLHYPACSQPKGEGRSRPDPLENTLHRWLPKLKAVSADCTRIVLVYGASSAEEQDVSRHGWWCC